MNAKPKIVICLAAALVIGIAIGAMLDRALTAKRLSDAPDMRQISRLNAERLPFKPTDAAQEAKIQKVLDQHARRLSAVHQRYRTEIETAFKSVKAQLDPILTPEQRAEMEKSIPGPPPPMPGGRGDFPGMGGPGGLGPGDERLPGAFPGGPTPGGPVPGGAVPGGPRPGMPGPGGPVAGAFRPDEFPLTRGPLAGQFGLAVMKAELKLSEEQAAKIKVIQTETGKDVRWTPDSRNPPPGPEVMKKVEREMQEAVLKVLTSEQQEKFRRLIGPPSGDLRSPTRLP